MPLDGSLEHPLQQDKFVVQGPRANRLRSCCLEVLHILSGDLREMLVTEGCNQDSDLLYSIRPNANLVQSYPSIVYHLYDQVSRIFILLDLFDLDSLSESRRPKAKEKIPTMWDQIEI